MEDATLLEVLFLIVITGTVFVIFKKTIFMISVCLLILTVLLIVIRRINRCRLPVKDKFVLVTGCESKVGVEIAKALHSQGFRIIATCSDVPTIHNINSRNFHELELDRTSDSSCNSCYHKVVQLLGGDELWGLVNCSSTMVVGDIELTSMEHYQKSMEVNLLGQIRVIKAFLPLIRYSQGRIVNIVSSSGSLGLPHLSSNAANHFAMTGFTESLRMEMKKFDVRVSLVESSHTFQQFSNLDEPLQTSDDMTREASDEILETYGEEYIKDVFDEISSRSYTFPQLAINDAVTDALLNEHYSQKYIVGDSQRTIDPLKCITRLRSVIPQAWITSLVHHYYGTMKDTSYEKKQYKKADETEEDKKEN